MEWMREGRWMDEECKLGRQAGRQAGKQAVRLGEAGGGRGARPKQWRRSTGAACSRRWSS